jgi:excisionase family DNA binding protein
MSSKIYVTRICEFCGSQFEGRTTYTRFCSKSCNGKFSKDAIRKKKIELSKMETLQRVNLPYEVLNAKPFLSVIDVSKLLGVSARTIFRQIKNGELMMKKVGRRTIISKDEIKRYFTNK